MNSKKKELLQKKMSKIYIIMPLEEFRTTRRWFHYPALGVLKNSFEKKGIQTEIINMNQLFYEYIIKEKDFDEEISYHLKKANSLLQEEKTEERIEEYFEEMGLASLIKEHKKNIIIDKKINFENPLFKNELLFRSFMQRYNPFLCKEGFSDIDIIKKTEETKTLIKIIKKIIEKGFPKEEDSIYIFTFPTKEHI